MNERYRGIPLRPFIHTFFSRCPQLPSDVAGETHHFERTNHVPADIDLPPMTAETCGGRLRVVIAVPVFAPRRDLKRAEPPDVLAGVHAFREAGLEMEKAIHEALHVKAVDQPDRADPEKTGPAEKEVAEAQ